MFGATSFGAAQPTRSVFGAATTTAAAAPTATTHNPMKDVEVQSPPDDTVSKMQFSPSTVPQTFLVAGSWDHNVRCWQIEQNGQTIPKAQQTAGGPVLDVCWSTDGSKVFTACGDKMARMWDLGSNQYVQIAAHDAPVKTIHYVKAPSYECVMTGSWDRTLKFWDTRQPNPMMQIQLPERCYCVDVKYPMAVCGTAGRGIIIYHLENQPQEFKKMESPLKYQHRCVSIFDDKKNEPTGFALGSVEGRVAIQYVHAQNPKDNFTFKCHRSNGTTGGYQDIYAVNDIAFHPVHGTLATVGSDGKFSFWDKDARTKLKTSEAMEQSITCCAINAGGDMFAYAVGYDWSKGHEFYNAASKNHIFLHPCYEELKPRAKK